MKYKLFSMPSCPKCIEIKEFLKGQKTAGEELSLAEPDGIKEMRKIYPVIREMLPRTECGSLPIPAVVFYNSDERIHAIATNLTELKDLLKAA